MFMLKYVLQRLYVRWHASYLIKHPCKGSEVVKPACSDFLLFITLLYT